ncbi:zeta toxin family protein [Streptomyces sp. NPDC018019]|uniref:zeta toxin family protein n=1 Tax=Streptomyces sp. NPDC018019 TaxID=3365030 RepID=UPI0037A55360
MRVRPETYRWQAKVEARVRAGHHDAVLEAPLADPQAFVEQLGAYRRAGHRIETVVLAVPEAVSQLGILDRYLRLARQGRARYVSWTNHDACAVALVATLRQVEARHLADRVFVVRRADEAALEMVYDNALDGTTGRSRRPAGAAQAVLEERRRPWDARETGRFRRQLATASRRRATGTLHSSAQCANSNKTGPSPCSWQDRMPSTSLTVLSAPRRFLPPARA